MKICANWIAEESNDLKSVVVSCFGPFQSLDTSKLDSGIYTEYGALANVEEYPGWGRLHIYHVFKSAFSEAGFTDWVKFLIQHKKIIETGFSEANNPKVRRKYTWMKNCHNLVLADYLENCVAASYVDDFEKTIGEVINKLFVD